MKIKLLFILSCLFCSTIVFAQNKKRYIYAPKFKNISRTSISPEKQLSDLIPESVQKEIYRIDILLPIHLDLLPQSVQHTSRWPQNSMASMNFYEGVLMAIDSLEKNEDMYYDIYIHDIANNKLDSLLKTNVLDSTDIIIAGVHSSELQLLSDYSLEKKINTFSVFSPADGNVKNNPFFFIFQPTLMTHLEKMFEYTDDNFKRYPTTLLFRETPGDEIAFTFLKSKISRRHNEIKISEDKIDMDVLRNKLVKNERNLVYTTFISPESTTNILSQLASLDEEYEVYLIGLPSWKSLPILTNGTLPKHIHVIIPYAFQYDNDDSLRIHVRNFHAKFQRGYPTEYTYRGYESLLWITDMLKNHGQYFNNKLEDTHPLSTEFTYKLETDDDEIKYFENKKIYFLKYNDSKLQLID